MNKVSCQFEGFKFKFIADNDVQSNQLIDVIKFAECEEYGRYIYKEFNYPSPIRGEADVVKKIDQCRHETASLILNGNAAKVRYSLSNKSLNYLQYSSGIVIYMLVFCFYLKNEEKKSN